VKCVENLKRNLHFLPREKKDRQRKRERVKEKICRCFLLCSLFLVPILLYPMTEIFYWSFSLLHLLLVLLLLRCISFWLAAINSNTVYYAILLSPLLDGYNQLL